MVAQTLQGEILGKVTTLLTDNIEALLPDLPVMREQMKAVSKATDTVATGGTKTY